MELKIKEGSTECTIEEAFKTLHDEEKAIAVTVHDSNGRVEEIRIFIPQFLKKSYEIDLYEITKYINQGKWYILPDGTADAYQP